MKKDIRDDKGQRATAVCFSGRLQCATGEELRRRRTLLPSLEGDASRSILDKALKEEKCEYK